MRTCYTVSLFLFFGVLSFGQSLTAEELLEKSIAYHDPSGVWNTFSGSLTITATRPDAPDRISLVTMDHPSQYFSMTVTQEGSETTHMLKKETCSYTLNGSSKFSKEEEEKYRFTCERTHMMKNYYSYLYGLPMKLKDPGTILDPIVYKKTFKGTPYLTVKVTYDAEVGKDTWYFYFNPSTFALEVYQFYHNEAKNDGEYILLDGLMEIQTMKIPQERSWFTNKDNTFLGADLLTATE